MPRQARSAAAAASSSSSSNLPGGLHRPIKTGEWWSVTQPDWDGMNRARQTQVAHAGNIMESEDGVMAANRCIRYVFMSISFDF